MVTQCSLRRVVYENFVSGLFRRGMRDDVTAYLELRIPVAGNMLLCIWLMRSMEDFFACWYTKPLIPSIVEPPDEET